NTARWRSQRPAIDDSSASSADIHGKGSGYASSGCDCRKRAQAEVRARRRCTGEVRQVIARQQRADQVVLKMAPARSDAGLGAARVVGLRDVPVANINRRSRSAADLPGDTDDVGIALD